MVSADAASPARTARVGNETRPGEDVLRSAVKEADSQGSEAGTVKTVEFFSVQQGGQGGGFSEGQGAVVATSPPSAASPTTTTPE